MKILLIALGTLSLVVLTVVVIGWLLPVAHVASRSQTFSVAPDSLFSILTNRQAFPEWRSKVRQVEDVVPADGKPRYVETGSDGAILYEVSEVVPGTRFVTRIADEKLPFGGTWTYELRAASGGTELRITENGLVYNPLFRFMSKFVFTHYATIDTFMKDLQKRVD